MGEIVVVYHYFAHYRKPVLMELNNQLADVGKLHFVADRSSNEPNLKLIDELDFINCKNSLFHNVKNIWVCGFLWQKGLASRLSEINPDVIIFLGQFNFITTWFLAILYRLKGRKVIFWGHGIYGNEGIIKKSIRNIFNCLPTTYMTYGNYAKSLMLKQWFSPQRIEVIFNSLDVLEQDKNYNLLEGEYETQDFYDLAKDAFNIVFIGRLTKIKRLDLLFQAVSDLINDGVLIKLELIGDGPELNMLKRFAFELNIQKNIIFHGQQHSEDYISKILFRSHICVSPGNVGLTAMHSLAYGTPVITHDNFSMQMPEFEAIQDGINGSFFKYNNGRSLKEKILYWINAYKDKERREIKCLCRKIILEKYNPSTQAKIIKEVIVND